MSSPTVFVTGAAAGIGRATAVLFAAHGYDVGAYDIPTFEWGTASSPIIWNDLVILQCDTQADSFLVALDAATGRVAWKTERDELPS